MFKLLTDEERKKVAHEYALRRAIVTFFAFTLVLAVGIIGLLPSYILSNARESEVLERTRIIGSAGEKGDGADLQVWLKKINHELQTLSPKLDTDRPSTFIEKVLDQKVAGARITGFSWAVVKGKITLSVDGVALDRQALIAFENSFNSSGYFSDVTFPISNLAQDKDINFQVKFSPARTTETVQSGGPATTSSPLKTP